VRPPVSLPLLDASIDARVAAIREAHPTWPCQLGCDLCCRTLPRLPVLTGAEWQRVREALVGLPAEVRTAIAARLRETPDAGPVPCPLLDPARGACLVYEARPIACRTYGYYTERDGGLHCSLVTRELEARGTADEVVWGHGEAISRALAEYGEALSLRDWMTEPLRGE